MKGDLTMLNPNRPFSLEGRAMAISCPMTSTLLELQFRNGTAFRYHEYIITAWCFHTSKNPNNEYSSAVYRYDTSTPEDTSSGRDANLVYLYDNQFEDEGEAVKTAILRSELLYSEELMKRKV